MYNAQHDTDEYRLHKLLHYTFYHNTVHIFNSKCLNFACQFQQNAPPIKFNVSSYSIFGIVIIKFTVVLYPLFVRRAPPLLLFL